MTAISSSLPKEKSSIAALAKLFFKLGAIAFGGPAAHIAMMEEEVVRGRQWMTKEQFLDLVGATNLIPGPNSTEMAIHVGYIRAGIPGLIVAGLSFIVPAVIITGTLAWLYVKFGSLPEIEPFFFGLKPVVVSVILVAVVGMGKTAVKNGQLLIIGISVAAASLAGLNEVLALLCGGAAGVMLYGIRKSEKINIFLWLLPFLYSLWLMVKNSGAETATAVAAVQTTGIAGLSLGKLGLFFLKTGAVLYGSGYVLVAFLEEGLVKDYAWLTPQQLLDAVAVGQFTPGPFLSTATFVGYVISGLPGAAISTIAIFLPSFFFVLLLNPLIPRLRASKIMSAFLDAVNVSAVGLMAAVVVNLGIATLADWRMMLIAVAALSAGWRYKINAAWLVAAGAAAGWFLQML